MFDSIAPWVQLGFAAAMCAFLMLRFVPNLMKEAREAAAAREILFVAALDKQAERCDRQTVAILEAHEEATKLLAAAHEKSTVELSATQEKIRERLHSVGNTLTIAVEKMRR